MNFNVYLNAIHSVVVNLVPFVMTRRMSKCPNILVQQILSRRKMVRKYPKNYLYLECANIYALHLCNYRRIRKVIFEYDRKCLSYTQITAANFIKGS